MFTLNKLILLAPLLAGAVLGAPAKDNSYDHYTFTHQWPASECAIARDTCKIPAGINAWTVHGLWPSRGNTMDPAYCDDAHPFNFTLVKDLLPDLEAHWPNIYPDKTEQSFWEHEWDKHGTCAEGSTHFNGEHDYFSGALTLAFAHNVTKALTASGIEPSDTKTFHISDINAALQKAFSTLPAVKCVHDKTIDKYVLLEVEMCIHKDTLEMVDCSQYGEKTTCWDTDEIAYPVPTH